MTKADKTIKRWKNIMDKIVFPFGGGELRPVIKNSLLKYERPEIPENYPEIDLLKEALSTQLEEIIAMVKGMKPVSEFGRASGSMTKEIILKQLQQMKGEKCKQK